MHCLHNCKQLWGTCEDYSTNICKTESAHARNGPTLPRAGHSGEITLAGSRRLQSHLRPRQSFLRTMSLQKQKFVSESPLVLIFRIIWFAMLQTALLSSVCALTITKLRIDKVAKLLTSRCCSLRTPASIVFAKLIVVGSIWLCLVLALLSIGAPWLVLFAAVTVFLLIVIAGTTRFHHFLIAIGVAML